LGDTQFPQVVGGLRTIFRTALALERAGYDVHFYVFGETHYVSGSEAAEAIRTFYPLKAPAHLGVTEMLPAEHLSGSPMRCRRSSHCRPPRCGPREKRPRSWSAISHGKTQTRCCSTS